MSERKVIKGFMLNVVKVYCDKTTASREDTDNCRLNASDYKFELHSLGLLCFLESGITSGRKSEEMLSVRRGVRCYYRIIEVEGFSLQIYRKYKKP